MSKADHAFQVAWWPHYGPTPDEVVVVDNIEAALLKAIKFSHRAHGQTRVLCGPTFAEWVLLTRTRVYGGTSVWFDQRRQDLTQFHRDLLKALYMYDESLNPML